MRDNIVDVRREQVRIIYIYIYKTLCGKLRVVNNLNILQASVKQKLSVLEESIRTLIEIMASRQPPVDRV